jgi:hypothetical protein
MLVSAVTLRFRKVAVIIESPITKKTHDAHITERPQILPREISAIERPSASVSK